MIRQVIRTLTLNLSRTFHSSSCSAVSQQQLLRVTRVFLPVPQLSSIPHTQLKNLAMQPEPLKTRGEQEHSALSRPAERKERKEMTETKKVKKPKKVKKKVCGRQQKEKEQTENLLAELPFASTEIWKELGFTGFESSTKKKRKRAQKGRVEGGEDEEKEKKKKKGSPRPNYFVSIPITNPKIKQTVEELQAEVLQKDPRLSRAVIPIGSLHITLLVTHLATEEDIHRASLALEGMQPTLVSLLGGRSLVLPFRGIGHFKQEVAFVQIEEGQHFSILTSIADSVRREFEENGVSPGDQKDFKPHLTFIKLSRAPKLRRQGVKKLDTGLYAEFEGRVFGEETVCSLDLCSMLKKKSADGYYHCEKTVTFSGKHGPELDDEELMSLSKRLVEDAVFRAVQQYMEETQQNGTTPKDEAPPPQTPNE